MQSTNPMSLDDAIAQAHERAIMTTEETQALIEWCRWRIETGQNRLLSDHSFNAAVVALAALTAPVDWQQRAEAAEALASNLNDGWLNCIGERDEARAKLAELVDVARAALGWIDAVPSQTELPAMPGFDRDWAEKILRNIEERGITPPAAPEVSK